ncbi:MAG TPA: hypothetical protein VKH46_17295 [Thermoanaerobaculia bacterium]|nr:hypothetical protein [Thermoanaerobaculia bacterium]
MGIDPNSQRDETMLPVEHLSRPEAIAHLREKLRTFADVDHCLCSAVGKLGIFCKGFAAASDAELKTRFAWIARTHPGAPREKLEELASLYHAGRQEATGAEICCDVETKEHGGCDGWNQFDNTALEGFHLALIGSPVKIV